MKHSLTICTITGRLQHEWQWAKDAIMHQLRSEDDGQITLKLISSQYPISHLPSAVGPKPTLWQGPHKITSQEWWAASNARNTGLCLAKSEWIAFLDDRCVPAPSWMEAVREAMDGGYMVFGSYEKRHGMKVENGRIIEPGTLNSMDNRWEHMEQHQLPNPYPCTGNYCYGCSIAMPLDWALQIGGFEEAMDGMGFEDVIFGLMAQNNGYPMRYDMRMHVVQDRTPGLTGITYRREDRGVSPNDKSHRALELFGTAKNTSNRHFLLQSRAAVQRGEPFPPLYTSRQDWWDGADIAELWK